MMPSTPIEIHAATKAVLSSPMLTPTPATGLAGEAIGVGGDGGGWDGGAVHVTTGGAVTGTPNRVSAALAIPMCDVTLSITTSTVVLAGTVMATLMMELPGRIVRII